MDGNVLLNNLQALQNSLGFRGLSLQSKLVWQLSKSLQSLFPYCQHLVYIVIGGFSFLYRSFLFLIVFSLWDGSSWEEELR